MDIRQLILPSGIGLSHLRVYDEPGPDGLITGGAHFHGVCSEIYYVLSGTGYVELLSLNGYQKIELQPNKVVFFRPGVIHRLVNPNKNLEILLIMQNGGLPERGDFILTFTPDIMADTTAYVAAARAANMTEALARRNAANIGFNDLRDTMLADTNNGRRKLREFYDHARRLLLPKVDGFEWVLKSGSLYEAKNSHDAIDFIRNNHMEYLEKATWEGIYPMNEPLRQGTSGTMHPYAVQESLSAEGQRVA